jgi:VanZ family protein
MIYFVAATTWALLIAYLCFTPLEKLPDFEMFSYDKIGHFGMFAGFVFLYIQHFSNQNFSSKLSKYAIGIAVCLGIFYSGMIEVIQHYWIPNRVGDWLDFVADVIGCGIGWLFYRLTFRLKKMKPQKNET